jgi:hypothetical protein
LICCLSQSVENDPERGEEHNEPNNFLSIFQLIHISSSIVIDDQSMSMLFKRETLGSSLPFTGHWSQTKSPALD